MFTIDVRTALIWLLLAVLIILVVFLIVAAKNLVTTIKKTNKILEDVSVVSEVAANKAVEIDEIVGDVQSAVSDIAGAVHEEKGIIAMVSRIVKAGGAIASVANIKSGDGAKKESKVTEDKDRAPKKKKRGKRR